MSVKFSATYSLEINIAHRRYCKHETGKSEEANIMTNRGGFSMKRALGVSKVKSKISRATGSPFTKSGRQRKIGKMVTGGCILPVLIFLLAFSALFSIIA